MFTFKKTVAFDKIKVPKEFEETTPDTSKVILKTVGYLVTGKAEAIHVNKDYVLFDDYITYLILKTLGAKKAKVAICKENRP